MSEEAKLIAKQTITPCFSANCNPNRNLNNFIPGVNLNSPYDEDKIFPDEIDSVSTYIKDNGNASGIETNLKN